MLEEVPDCTELQQRDGFLACTAQGKALRLSWSGAHGAALHLFHALDAVRIHNFSRAEALPVANNHNSDLSRMSRAHVADDNGLCASWALPVWSALDHHQLATALKIFIAECEQLEKACEKASLRRT